MIDVGFVKLHLRMLTDLLSSGIFGKKLLIPQLPSAATSSMCEKEFESRAERKS